MRGAHSLETRHKISQSHKGKKHPYQVYPKHYFICKICNKKVRIPPSHLKSQKYCSNKCYGIARSKYFIGKNNPKWSRLERQCDNCQRDMVVKSGRLLNTKGQGRFCSIRCWGIWQRKNMPKKATNIEMLIKTKLEENNIDFEFQKPIDNKMIVDFLVKGRLVIECDGDYWHSLPKAIERDKKRDLLLQMNGYEVLRLLGSEISADADKCFEKIQSQLK